MSQSSDYEVETASSGVKDVEFSTANSLKKGSLVVIRDQPCRVELISTSKPGKHGACKCNIVAKNIFTGKRLEDVAPSQSTIKVPVVKKSMYQVSYIEDDGFMNLIHTETSEQKEDLRIPEGELGEQIRELLKDDSQTVIITIQAAMGEEAVCEVKVEN